MTSEAIKFISYNTIPTDTGITSKFVLEVAIKSRVLTFKAYEFIPDEKIVGSSTYLVDSYERVRNVILGIATALEEAA